MKKALYKLLAVTLSLSLCSGAFAVAAYAKEASPESMHYNTYTVMGDSIAAGYATDNYWGGEIGKVDDDRVVEGTYADLVSQEVNAKNTIPIAHCGWRTTEMLRVLQDDFTLEDDTGLLQGLSEYCLTALYSMPDEDLYVKDKDGEWAVDENGLQIIQPSVKEHYRKSIQAADLITLEVGCNDVYANALTETVVKYEYLLKAAGTLNKKLQGMGSLEEAFDTLLKLAEVYGLLSNVLAIYFDALENGFITYKEYMPQVIDEIQKLNPDAKLLIVGVANPASATGSRPVKIWDYSEIYAARMNSFDQKLAEEKGCLFAKCNSIDYYGLSALDSDLSPSDENYKYLLVKMSHPTEEGHQQMADEILDVLQEDWDSTVQETVAEMEEDTDALIKIELMVSLEIVIG